MAQPTNTFDRYDQVGVREQLIEKITMTDPDKTPVTSMLGTGKATNTLYEFQRDILEAANADNAAIDGDNATGEAITPTQRLGNYCQIFRGTITLSDRTGAVNTAGRKDEMAYQKAKKFKKLHRDFEAAVLSKNIGVVGSSSVAPKMAGLGSQIYTNALHNGAGATAAHTTGVQTTAVTAGTNRAFTGALLETAQQNTYTNSGMTPPIVVVSPSHKVTFSTFSGIASNRWEVKGKAQGRIIGGADVYVSNFGEITVVPHYLMAGKNYVLGIDPEYADAVYLRGYRQKDLGPTGDNESKMLLVDATLAVRSEKCMFKIDDLTP